MTNFLAFLLLFSLQFTVHCKLYIYWIARVNSKNYTGGENDGICTVWEGQPFQLGLNLSNTPGTFSDPPGEPPVFRGNLADSILGHVENNPFKSFVFHFASGGLMNNWKDVNPKAVVNTVVDDLWDSDSNLFDVNNQATNCSTGEVSYSLKPDTRASLYLHFPMGMPASNFQVLHAGLWFAGFGYRIGDVRHFCFAQSYQRFYLIVLPRRMNWLFGVSPLLNYTFTNKAILQEEFEHESRCLSKSAVSPIQSYTLLQRNRTAELYWLGNPVAWRNCSGSNAFMSSDPMSSVNATTYYQICSNDTLTGTRTFSCSVPCTPHKDYFPRFEILLNGESINAESVSDCSPISTNPLKDTLPVYDGTKSISVKVNFDTAIQSKTLGFSKFWRLECRAFLQPVNQLIIPESDRCFEKPGEICLAHTIIDIIEMHNETHYTQCRNGSVPIFLSRVSPISTLSTPPTTSNGPVSRILIIFVVIVVVVILALIVTLALFKLEHKNGKRSCRRRKWCQPGDQRASGAMPQRVHMRLRDIRDADEGPRGGNVKEEGNQLIS